MKSRADVVKRMTEAMKTTLAELWAKRGSDIAVKTPQEAVILASIVEKETGIASERGMVAGLYSNRVKTGMMLQADPTIIYPITKGKPLGRRIRQSEISAINDYNTYSMVGMPKGPITNPGRASIAAVLNPDKTDALFMVADGKRRPRLCGDAGPTQRQRRKMVRPPPPAGRNVSETSAGRSLYPDRSFAARHGIMGNRPKA